MQLNRDGEVCVDSECAEETFALGRFLGETACAGQVFTLIGDLGVGKTVFTQGLAAGLGIEEPVNSPTFTIVNEYRAAKGFPIYHFDFYRITKLSEAYDIGIEEYFASDGLSLIEWPERVEELLPPEVIKVTITPQPDGTRKMVIGAEIEGL